MNLLEEKRTLMKLIVELIHGQALAISHRLAISISLIGMTRV
ncbi:hypothetical protein [Enterococcus sp. DIV2379]